MDPAFCRSKKFVFHGYTYPGDPSPGFFYAIAKVLPWMQLQLWQAQEDGHMAFKDQPSGESIF